MMEQFIQTVTQSVRQHQLVDLGLAALNPSLSAVWQAQQRITSHIKQPKIGYKIGLHPEFGAIWAPIFSHASYPPMGVMGYECEIALKIGGAMGRGQTKIPENSQLLVGIEILACPLMHPTKDFKAFLASGMGQHSYIIGDMIPYRDALCRADNRIIIHENGTEILNAPHSHPQGDPLNVLFEFLSHPPDNFSEFAVGDIITLGSVMGLKPIHPNMTISMTIQDIGGLTIKL